jgi:hypothetical protein
VLDKTYGALADLRRELSDSKADIAERTEILQTFARCSDSQRAWLLLEDYFEKLSLARKDFAGQEWWPRLMAAQGKSRLEETAMLFLRVNRPLPTELIPHADFERFAEIEKAEHEQAFVQQLENWFLRQFIGFAARRPGPARFNGSKSTGLHQLAVQFGLFRPRTGEKIRPLAEVIDLTARATQEQELFPQSDWEFITWLAEMYGGRRDLNDSLILTGVDLLQWLARWGRDSRLEVPPLHSGGFRGQLAELSPQLEKVDGQLSLSTPCRCRIVVPPSRFSFRGSPNTRAGRWNALLVGHAPPAPAQCAREYAFGAGQNNTMLTHLRRTRSQQRRLEQLCIRYRPTAVYFGLPMKPCTELVKPQRERQSPWQWSGHEWHDRTCQAEG